MSYSSFADIFKTLKVHMIYQMIAYTIPISIRCVLARDSFPTKCAPPNDIPQMFFGTKVDINILYITYCSDKKNMLPLVALSFICKISKTYSHTQYFILNSPVNLIFVLRAKLNVICVFINDNLFFD